MTKLLTGIVDSLGLAYWTEITTDNPRCTYYFGPFLSKQEALAAQNGYIEDLKGEEAQGIGVVTKRCQPQQLTIFDESDDSLKFKPVPAFGTQYY
ncbi:MAG: DUF1816 domain-containing protein [Xenococcaceae cyanobacterium MO_188.B32]|nr:DUF1816 domain-containing protein [Xenococcaceae cyanobacterium MO_188.B32]